VDADFPFCLAGEPSRSGEPLDVRNPFNGSVIGRTSRPLVALFPFSSFDAALGALKLLVINREP
jgi:hypothetical protein